MVPPTLVVDTARAARRPDGKVIRNERVADEAYRLDTDPDERGDLAGSDDDDDVIVATETALSDFESEMDGEWDDHTDDDVLDDMGEEAKDRLSDLGYIE
mgnify:CR=1 FL=1